MITAETNSALSEKSGPELVDEYNILAQKVGLPQIEKFSSRVVGVKRILRLLADHPEVQVAPANPEPPRKVEAPEKKTRQQAGRPFNLEASLTKRNYRENSGRGKLVAALRDGRTFEQLLAEFPQWDEAGLNKTIRIINWWLGFGIVEDESGVITLSD